MRHGTHSCHHADLFISMNLSVKLKGMKVASIDFHWYREFECYAFFYMVGRCRCQMHKTIDLLCLNLWFWYPKEQAESMIIA